VTLLPTALGAQAAGVATDPAGNVYVASSWPSHTISKMTPEGQVSTLAGTAGQIGNADGPGAQARFNYPNDVAADAARNVYVADTRNAAIRKIDVYGEVTTLAGKRFGSADGKGTEAGFFNPRGVATDRAGNVYVADTDNDTIRKITPAGDVSTLAGATIKWGSTDGVGAQALFGVCAYGVRGPYPSDVMRYCMPFVGGVAADAAGNVYVADEYNYTIRKITPAGEVTTLAGVAGQRGDVDGIGAQARFSFPRAIAADRAGDLYVIDGDKIRKVTPAGAVSTLIRGGVFPYGYRGYDLAADDAGNLYVTDSYQHAIRKVTPAGEVTTFAGLPKTSGSADGVGSEARFSEPQGIATDSAGNVYVADSGNRTIRKITPKGEVSTLAGAAGESGSADGTGAQARFSSSLGELAVDRWGNVYVADTLNYTIRKVTPTGEVSTLVGVAGRSGFTPGALPGLLIAPLGVAVSGTSLYITMDYGVAVVTDLP
jgi:sugar lactone lactonase YvrE